MEPLWQTTALKWGSPVARNFLPRGFAFELQNFNDSMGIRLKTAVHLGKKFLAAIFSAIVNRNAPYANTAKRALVCPTIIGYLLFLVELLISMRLFLRPHPIATSTSSYGNIRMQQSIMINGDTIASFATDCSFAL